MMLWLLLLLLLMMNAARAIHTANGFFDTGLALGILRLSRGSVTFALCKERKEDKWILLAKSTVITSTVDGIDNRFYDKLPQFRKYAIDASCQVAV